MKRKGRLILATCAVAAAPLWAHQGVRHGVGEEEHARVHLVDAGPGNVFKVTVAHLPEEPTAGQQVQFLVRFEEQLAASDPLLGGRAPFFPPSLEASMKSESSSAVLELREGEEVGVYSARHVFQHGGRWSLALRFENEAGTGGVAEIDIPLKSPPTAWSLLIIQAAIALGGLGFIAYAATRSGLSRLAACAAGGVVTVIFLFLASAVWPDNVEAVTGILEADALNVVLPSALARDQDFPRPSRLQLATGVIRYAPHRLTTIRTPFPGTVVYDEQAPGLGDRVEAGQALATIENRFNMHDYVHLFPQRWELLREVLQLREASVQAETAYQRAASLFELGTLSRREFEIAEFEARQAGQALKKAEERLALHDAQIRRTRLKVTEIVAPISGYITRAVFSAGQMVYEGDLLFEVVDLSEVWVEASVAPEDLARLQSHRQVSLRHASLENREFPASMLHIRPSADLESRMVRVFYSARNPDHWLREGMLVDVYPAEQDLRAGGEGRDGS